MNLGQWIAIICFTFLVLNVSAVNADELTHISIQITGDSEISLDSPNRIIRASIEIENFNPQDGYYYMRVVQLSTGKVLTETEIFPKDITNEFWATKIAYVVDENIENVVGDYKIKIFTEFGTATAQTKFSVIGEKSETQTADLIPAQTTKTTEEISSLISLKITKGHKISLYSPNRLVLVNMEIENFNPQDGYYFMKVVQLSTGKIVSESEIMPKDMANGLWGTKISYIVDESLENIVGDYKIKVFTEFGTATAKTKFSVIGEKSETQTADLIPAQTTKTIEEISSSPEVPFWVKNNAKWWSDGQIGDSDFVSGIQFMIKEKIINIPDLPEQASETAEEKVPDWIRNTAAWWSDGLISDDEFVSGIKYLVEQGIIKV